MKTLWIVALTSILIVLAWTMPAPAAQPAEAELPALQKQLAELQAQLARLQADIRMLESRLAQVQGPSEAGPGAQAAPPEAPLPAPPEMPTPIPPSDPTARILAEQLQALAAATRESGKVWEFAMHLDGAVFEFQQGWLSRSLNSLQSASATLAKERSPLAIALGPGGKGVNIPQIQKGISTLIDKARARLSVMPPASIVSVGEGGSWKTVQAEQVEEPLWYALSDVVEAQLGLRPAKEAEAPRFEIELKFQIGQEGAANPPALKWSYALKVSDLAKDKELLLDRKLEEVIFEPRPGEVPEGVPDVDLFLQAFDGHELFDLRPVPPELLRRISPPAANAAAPL